MRIREIREAQGLQQKVLAKNLGIKPNRLSQYETGAREPDLGTLDRIATELGVSVDDLMGRDEVQKKPTPIEGGGLSEAAQRFMPLVDRLTPEQQELLLAQLQAWTEQNQKQALAARQSDEGKVPKSDF